MKLPHTPEPLFLRCGGSFQVQSSGFLSGSRQDHRYSVAGTKMLSPRDLGWDLGLGVELVPQIGFQPS